MWEVLERQEALRVLRGGDLGVRRWNEHRERQPNVPSLAEIELSGAHLPGVRLEGTCLERAALREANLVRANLTRVRAPRADFRRASMSGACFAGAMLSLASFADADLRNADFTRAELRHCVWSGARLDGADFAHANLGDDADMLTADWNTLQIGETIYQRDLVERGDQLLPFDRMRMIRFVAEFVPLRGAALELCAQFVDDTATSSPHVEAELTHRGATSTKLSIALPARKDDSILSTFLRAFLKLVSEHEASLVELRVEGARGIEMMGPLVKHYTRQRVEDEVERFLPASD